MPPAPLALESCLRDLTLPTSTPWRTLTTKTSRSLFFQPTKIPGVSSFGASLGQKTRINPCFFEVIIPLRQILERSSPSQLFAGGNASVEWLRVLRVVRLYAVFLGGIVTDECRLPCRNALDGNEKENEEDGEDRKAFCCAGLRKSSTVSALQVSPCVPR